MNALCDEPTGELPQAEPAPPQSGEAWLWLIPAVALVLVAWLGWQSWHGQGILLNIRFSEGHGIKPGDTLRYRGVAVGSVEGVTLNKGLDGVTVELRLPNEASDLARAGSRFWIVRPQLDLSGVSGLDTVVGANYIGVLPGTGPPQRRFLGLAEPPLADMMEPGGLEIVLLTPGKGGLRPGAPISYRQVLIGVIVAVDLAKDASSVEARAYIKPQYINLIRQNTKFWRAGRARLSAGLDGLSLDLDSVPSLVLGGVNLAIPPEPGRQAQKRARFTLHTKPENDWLDWVPGLALDSIQQTPDERPRPVSIQLVWRERSWYYLKRTQEKQGWGLPLADGLLAPFDVLFIPEDALNGSVSLSVEGQTLEPAEQRVSDYLAWQDLASEWPTWPLERIRQAEAAENILIIGNPDHPARFVGAERQQWSTDSWLLQPALPFDESWHGAAVVAERDQNVLGLLWVEDDLYRVVTIPKNLLENP